MQPQSDIHKRILAAYQLLQQDVVSVSAFENIRTLLKGVHPAVDKKLEACSSALDKLQKIQSGDIITLSAEGLSEETEKDKKRKKALLFFIYAFKDLKTEVKRVEKEFVHSSNSVSTWGRIIGFSKGPLAVITIIAVVVVALKSFETEIVVKNSGCDTVQPFVPFSVSIPGLVLPSSAIPPSGQAIIKIPAISINVDASSSNTIKVSAFGLHFNYSFAGAYTRILFDGSVLSGTSKVINLRDKKQHELVIACS